MTIDELAGDPRIVRGTGTAPYNAPQLPPINENLEGASLNLKEMYNLKELHDKNSRGSNGARATTRNKRLPADVAQTNLLDDTGAKPVTANQGYKPQWTPNDKKMKDMFDGYSVKDGKLIGVKGTVLKRRKDGIKI